MIIKEYIAKGLNIIGFKGISTFPFINKIYKYKFPSKLKREINPEFLKHVDWEYDKSFTEISAENAILRRIWEKIPGGYKWKHYFQIYEQYFNIFKDKPVKLLEIGIYNGASLKMWREYFHKDSTIVGIDIDDNCREFENEQENIYCRIGSQEDGNFLNKIIDEFGKFDIIIDDGSHIVSHMIASFNYLFIDGLKENGIYIVEDVHTNFFKSHRDKKYSFLDYSRDLVDLMHRHYMPDMEEAYFRLDSKSRLEKFNVPRLTTQINSISFYDSVVVFIRQDKKHPPLSIRNQ